MGRKRIVMGLVRKSPILLVQSSFLKPTSMSKIFKKNSAAKTKKIMVKRKEKI